MPSIRLPATGEAFDATKSDSQGSFVGGYQIDSTLRIFCTTFSTSSLSRAIQAIQLTSLRTAGRWHAPPLARDDTRTARAIQAGTMSRLRACCAVPASISLDCCNLLRPALLDGVHRWNTPGVCFTGNLALLSPASCSSSKNFCLAWT